MHQTFVRTILATCILTAGLLLDTGLRAAPIQTETAMPSIPDGVAYVAYGPFIMGMDRPPAKALPSKQPLTARERLAKRPWSAEAFHDEGPAHLVLLDAYFIDKFETSNGQFGEFIKATGHPAPAYWDDPRLNKPEQPVVGVNWFDAKAFCEWKGKRLPTEAEWEKAARGPNGNRYPWGDTFDAKKVNYGKQLEGTLPVDALPAGVSYYGVHHMAGNVFEWVADWYQPDYYGVAKGVANPTGPSKPVWLGATGTYVDRLTVGEKRVIRGGSWIAAQASLTTTHRFWNDPMNNSYGVGLGFRCAQDAPAQIGQHLREMHVRALVKMGKEDYAAAATIIEEGLKLDPTNDLLMRLREQIRNTTGGSKRLP